MKYCGFAIIAIWSCMGFAQEPKRTEPEPVPMAPLAEVPYVSQLFEKNEAVVIQCAVFETEGRFPTTSVNSLETNSTQDPSPQVRTLVRRIEEEYLQHRASLFHPGAEPRPQGGTNSLFADVDGDGGARPFRVLAAPSLMALQGHTATVQIGSESVLEYLEPIGNDQYRRKLSEPLKLGLEAQCTVTEIGRVADSGQSAPKNEPAENEADAHANVLERKHAKVETVIRVSSLQGRMPVDGISLSVGKPIVQRQSIETTLDLVEGKVSHLVLATSNERSLHILIWIGWKVPENARG